MYFLVLIVNSVLRNNRRTFGMCSHCGDDILGKAIWSLIDTIACFHVDYARLDAMTRSNLEGVFQIKLLARVLNLTVMSYKRSRLTFLLSILVCQ